MNMSFTKFMQSTQRDIMMQRSIMAARNKGVLMGGLISPRQPEKILEQMGKMKRLVTSVKEEPEKKTAVSETDSAAESSASFASQSSDDGPQTCVETEPKQTLNSQPEEKGIDIRQAILWSEILGEPACRKRRNRNGNQSYFSRR